ncbi:MAG: ferritin [Nitrospirae bacterium]|nr:MAG: ferritin [Nitrospirota bacterium]
MASKELMDKLNDAIARELQVSVQYMWQHVMATGMDAEPVREIFKQIAITEMKHAEEIAERLDYLGGRPTTKPTPIKIGETPKEMIELDKQAEEEAIELYREIIELAEKERDYTTKRLFEQILADEEEHHGDFSGLLE